MEERERCAERIQNIYESYVNTIVPQMKYVDKQYNTVYRTSFSRVSNNEVKVD